MLSMHVKVINAHAIHYVKPSTFFVTIIFISTEFSKNITNPGVLLFFLFYIRGTVHQNIVDQFCYFSS